MFEPYNSLRNGSINLFDDTAHFLYHLRMVFGSILDKFVQTIEDIRNSHYDINYSRKQEIIIF